MTSQFSIFGLRLEANKWLAGLAPARGEGKPDVRVWLGLLPGWWSQAAERSGEQIYPDPKHEPQGGSTLTVWKLLEGAYFRFQYGDGTEFLIRCDGREIWTTWPDTATLADTATYLLGPVLGFVLRLRGTICLHSSAVVIDDQVVALLGAPGAGKSTTAAAFALGGYRALSDDVVALSVSDDVFMAQPGYPRLCLWPNAVEVLFRSPNSLPQITPNWDKRYLDLAACGDVFSARPLPLAAIYVLAERIEGDHPFEALEVRGEAAMMQLVKNSYVNYLLDGEMRAREFELLSRLAASVPVRWARFPADPALLASSCQAMICDFRNLHALTCAATGLKQGTGIGV